MSLRTSREAWLRPAVLETDAQIDYDFRGCFEGGPPGRAFGGMGGHGLSTEGSPRASCRQRKAQRATLARTLADGSWPEPCTELLRPVRSTLVDDSPCA